MIQSRPLSSLQSRKRRLQQSFQGQTLASLFSARLSWSIGAQALVSGFHFLLNLWMVREHSLHDYGVFAFAFVLVMFGNAINNALISTPLTIYTPVIKDAVERERQEVMLGTANVFLVLVVLLCAIIYCTVNSMSWLNVLGMALFVAVNCARHFSRSTGYARLQPLITATGEATYVMIGTVLVLLMLWRADTLAVGAILLALTAAQCAAILVERLRLHGNLRLRFRPSLLSGYGHYWEQSRWGLIGALTTLLWPGAQHYRDLLAGSCHLRSTGCRFCALRSGACRADDVAKSGQTRDCRRTIQSRILEGKTSIASHQCVCRRWRCAGRADDGPDLAVDSRVIVCDRYADQPMAKIVTLWAIITLFVALYNAPSAALQALRDFKILACASAVGATISTILVMLILHYRTPSDTLYGILCAELFMLVFLYRVLAGKLQSAT